MADNHREIFRVDRSGPNGAVRIVPEAELKPVGDAPYFRATIRLAADQIYVSPVHLSEENGVIATPQSPTCRSPRRSWLRRQAVRNRHRQRRHATRAGAGPVIGAAGRKRLSGRPQGRLSDPPRRPREFGSQLGRPPTGGSDIPISQAWSAQRKVSRANRPRTGSPAAWRSRPPYWPAANGSRIIETVPTPSSWRRRRRSGTARLPSG